MGSVMNLQLTSIVIVTRVGKESIVIKILISVRTTDVSMEHAMTASQVIHALAKKVSKEDSVIET